MSIGSTTKTMASSVAPGVTSESRPVPDPTVLTTQQIFNSVAALRDVIDVRLCGMDQAVNLLQQAANRKPTIGELEAKFDERFKAIEMVFHEREQHGAALAASNLVAVQTALQAQRDAAAEQQKTSSAAVAKAETATNDSLSQLEALFQSSVSGLNTQFQDMKSRLDRGEGIFRKEREDRSDNRNTHLDSRSLVFSVIASAAAIGAVIISILNFAKLH